MANSFLIPHKIITGFNALDMASSDFKNMGNKALLVCDEVMIQLGNIQLLCSLLEKQNINYSIFSAIHGEPTDEMITQGVNQFKNDHCDFLIAMGGGSPLDAMKAIAMMSQTTTPIHEFMGKDMSFPRPCMIAIPTTAGTGSEATQFTIITDTQRNVKMLLKGAKLIPDLAIVDPSFTLSVPPSIHATCGIDALCHAIEAYTSKKAQPLSDSFALSAIKRIFLYLPIVYKNPTDEQARLEMSLAALEAGIAFNNSSVTLVHGMSRPLGAIFHIPHGLSNAMLLKTCLSFAREGAISQLSKIAHECHYADDTCSDEQAVNRLFTQFDELLSELSIPSLFEYGINEEDYFSSLPKMANDAFISLSPANTLREVTIEDMIELYKQAYQ